MGSPASIIDSLAHGITSPQDLAIKQAQSGQIQQQTQNLATENQGNQLTNQLTQQAMRDNEIVKNAFVNGGADPIQYAAKNGISGQGYLGLQKHLLGIKEQYAKLNKDEQENAVAAHTQNANILMGIYQTQDPAKRAELIEQSRPLLVANESHLPDTGRHDWSSLTPDDASLKFAINANGLGGQISEQALKGAQIKKTEQETATGAATQANLVAQNPGLVAGSDIKAAQQQGMQNGLLPEEQVRQQQAAAQLAAEQARAAETARHNRTDEGISGAHLGLAQKEFSAKYGGGSFDNLSESQKQMAQRVANGDISIGQLSRLPDKEAIMNGAMVLNPEANRAYEVKEAFTNPDKAQSKNLGTISRIVGHIGQFEHNSQGMGFAPAYGAGMNITGGQAKLNEDAHAISGELEKLVSGGVGSVEQVKAWQKGLHSPSADARQQAIDEISRLVGSQYEGMNQTYKAGTGKDLPIEKYVTPAGQQWMKMKGINVVGAANAPSGGGMIRAVDPSGKLHQAPAGTPLPDGWKKQ